VTDNSGWVVGITYDTAQFAVNAIRRWLDKMGRQRYPTADRLLITADCGGSNAARTRLWRTELQKLADETGLTLSVCHYPPGTSKWNKIEYRMFCYISQNWRSRPLTSRMTVVELIAATTTKTGLTVACELDTGHYPKGIRIKKQQDAHPRHSRRCIPSRVELHGFAKIPTSCSYLGVSPKLERLASMSM
jgi:hypothetical protein